MMGYSLCCDPLCIVYEKAKSAYTENRPFPLVSGTKIAVYCLNSDCQKFLHVECCQKLQQNAVAYFNRNNRAKSVSSSEMEKAVFTHKLQQLPRELFCCSCGKGHFTPIVSDRRSELLEIQEAESVDEKDLLHDPSNGSVRYYKNTCETTWRKNSRKSKTRESRVVSRKDFFYDRALLNEYKPPEYKSVPKADECVVGSSFQFDVHDFPNLQPATSVERRVRQSDCNEWFLKVENVTMNNDVRDANEILSMISNLEEHTMDKNFGEAYVS
jgi:hypothetical protein